VPDGRRGDGKVAIDYLISSIGDAMNTLSVVVVVKGGAVQNILADVPVRLLLLDYDDIEQGEEPHRFYPVQVDAGLVQRLMADPLCESGEEGRRA
jgi:hypothetical protein